MSQPKLEIHLQLGLGGMYWVIAHSDHGEDIDIASAKTKQAAYNLTAAKLRKLADEAERLAEEE